jgi:hypothetical protein
MQASQGGQSESVPTTTNASIDNSWWARRKCAFARPTFSLILRSREAASRRMGGIGASWFETALKRLLTMRSYLNAPR